MQEAPGYRSLLFYDRTHHARWISAPTDVGKACTHDSQCSNSACDTGNLYSCSNKCVADSRDASKTAASNCPQQISITTDVVYRYNYLDDLDVIRWGYTNPSTTYFELERVTTGASPLECTFPFSSSSFFFGFGGYPDDENFFLRAFFFVFSSHSHPVLTRLL